MVLAGMDVCLIISDISEIKTLAFRSDATGCQTDENWGSFAVGGRHNDPIPRLEPVPREYSLPFL